MPSGPAGSGPWAADGPDAAWWRGDPAAAAARFAAVRPTEPPIPPAPTVELTPTSPPVPEPDLGLEPPPAPVAALQPGRHAIEPEPQPAEPEPRAAEPEPAPGAVEAQPVEPEAVQPEPEPEPEAVEPETVQLAAEPEPRPVDVEIGPAKRETVLIPVLDRVTVPEPAPAADDEPPFWMPSEEMPRAAAWPTRQMRAGRGRAFSAAPIGRTGRRTRPPKPTRSPAAGLVALLVLSLLATFFAWVSAEPLWLAVGHGNTGTATVAECTGSGVGQRCLGEFTATGGAFTAERVRLLGVSADRRAEGTAVAARMVAADSGRAYVGDAAPILHLRWALGLALVLLCGLGIVWATGANRLDDARSRRRATLAGVAAPLLVAVAFLAATF